MYKVFLQFPEALRPAFPRLKEKLEDPDPGMLSQIQSVNYLTRVQPDQNKLNNHMYIVGKMCKDKFLFLFYFFCVNFQCY